MMVTLADVARAADVSTATASLVLSDKAHGRVSATTAERVRQSARALGYVRNALAASMRSDTTRTLGVIAHDVLSTPYAVSMVDGILTTARHYGWTVLFTDAGNDDDAHAAALKELRSRRVDAVIYAAMYHQRVCIDPHGADVVILNGFADRPGLPGVVPDEETAADTATTHLLDLGHRRIAHLTDQSDACAVELRIAGYRRACERAGVGEADSPILQGSNDPAGADALALRLLDLWPRPTAVFCYNDALAAGVYRQALARGLSIPRDLSVIGFDDLQLISTNVAPPLTTMRLPHLEMASWLTRHLVTHGPQSLPDITRTTCELILRHSTAPPAATER